ncbi:hypothetical protein [Streptomyces atriruber]|uniref:hypothetical protein n=1 Tax=Streptomyces atriruber TaxID=545121 RepID=UPI000AF323B6|nr:hypothetical protein [Streptomyces atriruber]
MVYVRTPGYGRGLGLGLGQGPVRPPGPGCAGPARSAAAHDAASAELIAQLRLPITSEQTALQARRANALRRLFGRLDGPTARRLAGRLDDMTDDLARFFDCELSTPLRAELRALLVRPPEPAAVPPPLPPTRVPAPWPGPGLGPGPWIPGVPPPVPPASPGRPVPPRLPVYPPPRDIRDIFDFRRTTGPGISVTDLLHRARQVLDGALAVGAAGAAVAALGAALTGAQQLAGLIGGSGIGTALIFDTATGKLSMAPFPPGTDPHYLTLRARAAALQRPEWGQLEQRLREVARFEDVVRERARDARGRWQKPQPGDKPPGAPFEDLVCDRVRRAFPYSARSVHVRAFVAKGQPGSGMGSRVIIDCIGSRWTNRGLRLFEAKSGGSLRRHQIFEYPRLERNGGVIVSDRYPYRAGQRIPVGTAVTIVTPANIDSVLPP